MPRPSGRGTARALALAQESMLAEQGRQTSALAQLLANGDRQPTRRQRRIADEVHTRAGVVHGTLLLQGFATEAIGRMHAGTQLAYVRTVRQINAAKASAYLDEETARDIADWTFAQKEMLRRHLATNLEAGASRVIELTGRELYEPDGPKGFLARLFGS